LGRPSRERQKENPPWIGASRDESRHAMHERLSLARAGTRDDEERSVVCGGGSSLRRVQGLEDRSE
jgi:hypothetical protein